MVGVRRVAVEVPALEHRVEDQTGAEAFQFHFADDLYQEEDHKGLRPEGKAVDLPDLQGPRERRDHQDQPSQAEASREHMDSARPAEVAYPACVRPVQEVDAESV